MQPRENEPAIQPTPVSSIEPQVIQPTILAPSAIDPALALNVEPVTPAVASTAAPVVPTVQTAPIIGAAPQTVFMGSVGGADVPGSSEKKSKFPKAAIFGLVGLVLVALAGSGFYFGYYTNPTVVYQQSLANSGKGLDKLTTYLTTQQKNEAKSYRGDGSYKVVSGDTTTDGKLSFKSTGKNSEVLFDIGLGITRVNVTARTIASANSTNPDIYLKASGIKGLGALTGSPELDATTTKLDDKWIAIDHTLLDNLQQQAVQTAKTDAMPTRDQVLSEIDALTKVNQEYIFSTKADKAVTKVLKTYGTETIDGHKVVHYQVGFVKPNVKQYISAQQAALKTSKLNDWIKKNNYQEQVDSSFKDALKSVDSIKDTDTIDVWADINERVIYKVRVADSKNMATNYVDLGIDYKGGDSLPFFIQGATKSDNQDSSFSLKTTVNTKTNEVVVKLAAKDNGSSKTTVSGDMTFKPSSEAIKIDAPAKPLQITEVLQQLGFGDILGAYLTGGIQAKAKDAERQTDIQSFLVQLEAFYADNGYYPSLAQINDASWRSKNMKSLDASALQDPDGTIATLAAAPAARVYAYQPKTATGTACDNSASKQCDQYDLTATLDTGVTYVKKSLN